MNPSKIRERKCSTCKHYQPSPLWRKGWCRNPLLYDRNTNHLVEADSLACNRTFIDYWEPITGPVPMVTQGAAGRGVKPRIAPSIPMDMVDARGQRVTHTGSTPMSGMSTVADDEFGVDFAQDEAGYVQADDLSHDPRATLEMAEIDSRNGNGVGTGPIPIEGPTKPQNRIGAKTAAQKKPKVVRPPQRPIFFGMGRDRLILIGITALVVLVAVASGIVLLSGRLNQPKIVPATATAAPLPTPTGFGDPTSTVPPAPTVTLPPPPPSDVIAIGGWVQATSNVTIRSDATTAAQKLGILQNGNNAHVIDGPKSANNYNWWKVDSYDTNNPSASGWIAGEFVKPIPPP